MVAMVGKVEQWYTQDVATVDYHKYLVEEVHGAAQAGEGLQDALNHQDEHDHTQMAVQGEKESHLVQDW